MLALSCVYLLVNLTMGHDGLVICVLQLVFSARVAAVKSRPVLHHCLVIFFWSSGIMECTGMLYTFVNGVHALGGVSGVASFITTDEQHQ